MTISVIILTHNAENFLQEQLHMLFQQNCKLDEIIVIDTESTDKTLDILQSYPMIQVRSITKHEFDHGGTRNLGLTIASGDFVIFLTQDAIPCNNNTMSSLLEPLYRLEIIGVYGRQVPREDANPIERFVRQYNYPDYDITKGKADIERYGIKAFFFSNVCAAYNKEQILALGGFPARTIVNEDMLMAYKIIQSGRRTMYATNARVFHSHNYNLVQQFRRYFDIGVFFQQQKQLFAGIRLNKEGGNLVKSCISDLIRQKQYLWCIYLLMDTASRLGGYKCGNYYKLLPKRITQYLSNLRNYW